MAELVCMNENAAVDVVAPRCRHPSSACRFREWCQVMEAIREKSRLAKPPEGDGRT